MNELALFAGAGGGILGGHLLGWRTVCAVELEPYAASVLVARQNDGILPPFPIWDDVCTFDGRPWRGVVDVVSGGFPCQDISIAGKGAGLDGERSGLWKEMAGKLTEEDRPTAAEAYKARVSELKRAAAQVSKETGEVAAPMTYAQVAAMIEASNDQGALDLAMDMIRLVDDELQRDELVGISRRVAKAIGASESLASQA